MGTVAGDTYWRAVAPVAVDVVVDDWQFCTANLLAMTLPVKSFDQWVADAEGPDTAFTIINEAIATVRAVSGLLRCTLSGLDNLVVLERCLVESGPGHRWSWCRPRRRPRESSWTCNVESEFGFNICYSADGVTWDNGFDLLTKEECMSTKPELEVIFESR